MQKRRASYQPQGMRSKNQRMTAANTQMHVAKASAKAMPALERMYKRKQYLAAQDYHLEE